MNDPLKETLADKWIVLTGGAGGIGRACIDAFVGDGARVLAIDADAAALDTLVQTYAPERIRTAVSKLDSPEACKRAIAKLEGPAFALVHLAGLFEKDEPDPQFRDVWDRALAVNLTTAYDMVSACVPAFDAESVCRIVFAASVAYRRGSFDHLGYSAAKGGIAALVRALSRRLAPNVLVNAVAPGIIVTRMTQENIAEKGDRLMAEIPLRRWGNASEVASVIRFLCSPDSSYVTGQIINVDGGMANS
jgi:3-oxoacyl-[acyl-carrier protein] reductase